MSNMEYSVAKAKKHFSELLAESLTEASALR